MGNEKTLLVPPYANRGALSTSSIGLRACVDWVQATFPASLSDREIIEFIGLDFGDFRKIDAGKYGYTFHYRSGHIALYGGGREDMGWHLEITGQGCREYERIGKDWDVLFGQILFCGRFTRVDLAIDDFEGYFSLGTVEKKVKKAELTSRFRQARVISGYQLADGGVLSKTVRFGSDDSRISVIMYDKRLERLSAGKQVDVDFWQRTEIRMRDERAQAAAYLVAHGADMIGRVARSVLASYIMFRRPVSDGNKSRWPICDWWDKFIGEVDKLSLSRVAPDRTIEDTVDWIERQVSPSMSAVVLALADYEVFERIVLDGLDRLTDAHIDKINRYRVQCGMSPLSHSDLRAEFLNIKKASGWSNALE
ncbi:replication initiation factor domain-containing protein [Geobacillus sp. LEMMY01]|uniref:replication initiation factor domain-containing protein n=1 Tax=Geobacillus sp. LEMMY01 TaxID=1954237 RepID=UPI0009ACF0E2|nr:replication initiation factor domain-containing protein [Geobacillus sp. LEMMY01]OPX01408.1 hypothetical protein B1A75_15830 [Geobacillus sp. LEMMY01]OPX01415.1 hypothetical protein B1A75_15865 [Geobacillus sp. LEMMY01]